MNFCDAMERLKAGAKVTRQPWDKGLYFQMEDNDVKSYQPKLSPYIYNEDIMVSEGWIVSDDENKYKFCEIIPFLLQGKRATLDYWTRAFIYYDKSSRSLVLHSMEVQPFIPDFESFTANDWIVIK